MVDLLSFLCIRALTFPFSLLPYSWIHACGRVLGRLTYYLFPRFRKKALSNLALAQELHLTEKEIIETAKLSFENLMITCLEYAKLSREQNIENLATCINPELAFSLLQSGKGVIFFCAHQTNWEILFLEGTRRMPGVAIGRPIKNQRLYNWILRMREKYGGRVIEPKEAVKEGLRALKTGSFLGIVGDQGMPDSPFSSSFLGKTAWTSPLPALLSIRTGAPIIVATTKREKGKYLIQYSAPLFPQKDLPKEQELQRLMKACLSLLEESIKERPGEWLWQHNRWKQQTPENVRRPFRQESILLILPEDPSPFLPHLSTFREIYPREFITVLTPQPVSLPDAEIVLYRSPNDLFLKDFRFKLVFNFTLHKGLRRHFLKQAAFHVASLEDILQGAPLSHLSPALKKKLCYSDLK